MASGVSVNKASSAGQVYQVASSTSVWRQHAEQLCCWTCNPKAPSSSPTLTTSWICCR